MTWSEEDSRHLTPEGWAWKAEAIRVLEERERFLMMTSRWYRIRSRVGDVVRRIRYRIRNI